jgi:phosphoribosyl-AMP cyclohydrolase
VSGRKVSTVPPQLKYNEAGLVCAVAQQFDTKEVLMVAWMDAEALRRTLETGRATYFSRSRNQYWVKGETSGNTQRVVAVRHDCDADALLVLVDQVGSACHTGTRTCFDDGLIQSSAGISRPAVSDSRSAVSDSDSGDGW